MAELHEALKFLGPAEWSDIPTEQDALDGYLSDLFQNAQLILDSVPLPSPDESPLPSKPLSQIHATKAAEVSLSAERNAAPPFGHEKYQKEWGKPMKIKAQENPLGLSVYKMSGKDGKGSWFARHSIHEGISFSKFRKSLEMEFEKSLSEPGPPGTGSVRGIGSEERVEQIKSKRANVEVYRLSAQFPGPTAARDFVTLLITSDKAMRAEDQSKGQPAPRHYMILSRPCNHPNTQPRNGFVRGFYESVEFIREIPRKPKNSQSSIDLSRPELTHQRTSTFPSEISVSKSPGRQRAVTVGQPSKQPTSNYTDSSDPQDNPVEWLMITRSDPGGGIPRFLVDRGTPSSICGDAVKFVDWACQNDDALEQLQGSETPAEPSRRESFQSWKGRSLVGVAENNIDDIPESEREPTATVEKQAGAKADQSPNPGLLATVSDAAANLRSYTPQVILNHLPAGGSSQNADATRDISQPASEGLATKHEEEDSKSIMSSTSFASAEDHWSSDSGDEAEELSIDSSLSNNAIADSKEAQQHEKELRKLDERKQALHKRFAATQTKIDEARARQAETDAHITVKAHEKHERDRKKHADKYQKELQKIEAKQAKERKRVADRAKKQADKDEKRRLTRERDDARKEVELIKKEAESLRQIVQDLQKENTALVIKLGKVGMTLDVEGGTRSRGSSLSRKEKKELSDVQKGIAVASAAASTKSN